jgi:hypothetical protein
MGAAVTDDDIILVFETILGMPPRRADLAVLLQLESQPTPRGVAEYIWDHMMGEPDKPSCEEVAELVARILQAGKARSKRA